jgi:hypothetical protein
MDKIQEQLSLPNEENYESTKRELILAWRKMAQRVNTLFTLYNQADMPVVPINTTSLWLTTDAIPKCYLVTNFNGDIKKVELT